jgi:molybdopterin-containing oxidoreductase family iron-sulfur binding subunit
MALQLEAMRQRLAAAGGRHLWRGLEEFTDSEEFQEYLWRELPEQAAEWTDPVTRRQFLTLMGASLALAGLSGCSTKPAPAEKIMPYVRQPEQIIPGRPLFFATAMTLGGFATGLLVESHEGRPTKVEGNPNHPASRGATDIFAQASVLTLYDPDRSQSVTYRGRPRAWSDALGAMRMAMEKLRKRGGQGLRILTETVTSPTLAAQMEALLKSFPEPRWHQYEPTHGDNCLAGARQAFGRPIHTYYDLSAAAVILSLDADFLTSGPGHLAYVRDFSEKRRLRQGSHRPERNRLYAVEAMPTSTGAVADHRLPLRPGRVADIARAVATALGVTGAPAAGELAESERRWVAAVSRDLKDHASASLIIAGESQPPAVHALVHATNAALANVGKTVIHTDPVEVRAVDHRADLRALVEDMREGRVQMLAILGGNPVLTAPADLEFGQHLERVPFRVHLGLYADETAVACDWHIPEAHYLESWSDARAYDGTASIVQPLIAPLYEGKSAHEVLAAFTDPPEQVGRDIVRDHWRRRHASGEFEAFWHQALREGVIPNTRFEELKGVGLRPQWADAVSGGAAGRSLEIVFRPDPALYDGRFANNGWLQELPKPVTKLTWDNAAFLSPQTAAKLRVGAAAEPGSNGGEHGQAIVDVIELSYRGQQVTAPIWVLPGHADDCVTVHLGHGRERAGRVGNGSGFNVYPLRTSAAPWFDAGLEIRKTGTHHTLACTQMHHRMEGREPVRFGTADWLGENVQLAHSEAPKHEPVSEGREPDRRLVPLTLYKQAETEFNYDPPQYRWGMAIDLGACTGCGACVVACQAENNIPVVGKIEVTRGREMHWLRVDRYYVGGLDNPTTYFQPVPCMHCENAPCELVCPVGATVHSEDGLNDMVYNRCVGTRYCSNNCPYKVRRFNFLQFADYATGSLKLLHNPNVTVRSRGVMEKCTYCVQRIRAADIAAEKEGRHIADGEVVTACQAACPARAIVFGDINDKKSQVLQWKEQPLNYDLLGDLNTRPRTSYLAAARNPNPDLK